MTKESLPIRFSKRFKTHASAMIIMKKGQERPVVLKDISAYGLRVVSSFGFEKDQQVTVIIRAPFFDGSIGKTAQVVWCKKIDKNLWETGLDFIKREKTKKIE